MDDRAIFGELAATLGALEILCFLKDKGDEARTLSPSVIGLGHNEAAGRDFLSAAHLLMDMGLIMAEAVQMAVDREPLVMDALITQRGARLMSPDHAEGQWMAMA